MPPSALDARVSEDPRGGYTRHMTGDAPLANTFTLGVEDLDRERSFYRDLGWPIIVDSDDFVVFELRGALLALFPVDKLAEDSRARAEPRQGGIRSAVIIGVDQPSDV